MKQIYKIIVISLIFVSLIFGLGGCGCTEEDPALDSKWQTEKFDIIIQAGQSNSEGCGVGEASEYHVKTDNILYLTSNFTIKTAEETAANNFSLAFAREYVKEERLEEGRKLLIIRAAVGGTGFLDGRWTANGDLYKKMHKLIKASLELNSENRLIAFLWHQGETDAQLNASETVHYNNLKSLVNSVKNTYNCQNLPFIAGDFVAEWKAKNIDKCEPVINAIKRVCTDVPPAEFIETGDLLSNNQETGNGDDIHFSREALNILGKRYFEIFKNLI